MVITHLTFANEIYIDVQTQMDSKNNVCKYIDLKIYMDSAHHQNNNQPRHARRRRNKEYGNWKLGLWTKWDPYWWTISYGWSSPKGKINSRADNI